MPSPITAIAAGDDAIVRPDAMAEWQKRTHSKFRIETWSGGHFAVLDRPHAVFEQVLRENV